MVPLNIGCSHSPEYSSRWVGAWFSPPHRRLHSGGEIDPQQISRGREFHHMGRIVRFIQTQLPRRGHSADHYGCAGAVHAAERYFDQISGALGYVGMNSGHAQLDIFGLVVTGPRDAESGG